jgi:glyoxylase-like metal-dependent hydrolase (beta-lactamase superfamily II)
MIKRLLPAALVCVLCVNVLCTRVDLSKSGLVRITDRVYAFIAWGASSNEGLGANSGFVVGSQGVLVVDSRYTPALARELLGAIRSVTGAPVLYVVNTHYHPDHCWGNSVFKDEGAVIVSHTQARADLEKHSPEYMEYYKNYNKETYEKLKTVKVVLPDTTFGNELELDLGDVEVVLSHLGPAHTAGDCIVTVPSERVIFTGGVLSNGYHANLNDEGADIDNWIVVLDRLEALRPGYIVPGQGRVCRRDELERQKEYIQTLRRLCIEEIKRETPLNDAVRTVTVPGAEDYLQPNILAFNVRSLYQREMMRVVKPDFSIKMPKGFLVADGGGETSHGFIRWAHDGDAGHLEIEIRWQPTRRKEIIVQDINDQVARFAGATDLYNMQIDGTKRLVIGGGEVVASHGRWSYKRESWRMGAGPWTWTMTIGKNKMFSIRMLANTASDEEKERQAIAQLENIVSTITFK